ncbi:MAG: hypothetical protein IJE57_04410 [Anaerotignum sp.]|nr:hypothetical protein [Anaerotignum sp.]
MFTKPRNGWTDIVLDDFEGLGSYIQDVPVEVMEATISALKKDALLELHFDEEGSEFTLTADENTKIVAQGYYGPETYEVKRTKTELIREIFEDMEEYFTDWVEFSEEYVYFEDDEAEQKQAFYEEREIVLKALLNELKSLL